MIQQSCNAHIAFKIRRMHNHVEKKKEVHDSFYYVLLAFLVHSAVCTLGTFVVLLNGVEQSTVVCRFYK
jgi:hypothetical protein